MGPTVIFPQLSSTIITEATMRLLLQLMAQTFEVTIGSNFARSAFTHKGEPFDQSFSAQDETDIPPASSLVVTNETFVFAPLEWMKEDLNGLLPLFGRDADFRNLVMKTFEVIFRPENVLAVTYNPIFGSLWRLCCRQRLDPRLDDLTAKLSQCVPTLTGGAKVQVSQWLEESYNDSQRIRDAIANAAPLGPCFTLDIGHLSMSKASIRSLARAPQPGVLEGVQNILARLQYHQSPPVYSDKEDDDLMYLPQSHSNEYLFSFLPHLMFPCTTLSQRGVALVALVRTWLPFDYAVEFPEIFSAEFVQLLYRGQAYLTPFEQQVYRQLFVVHRLRLAATKDVDVDSLWPDRKARCHTCGYDTSLSLMVSPTLCAMCVTYGDDAPTLQANTVVSGNESHIVECHDCHGIYAVLQVALQRLAVRAPTSPSYMDGPPTKSRVRLSRWCFARPTIPWFKLFTQKRAVLLETSPAWDGSTVLHMVMHFQGKAILQSSAIYESLKAIVLTDEFSLPCLSSACGRCPTKVCTPCLTKWFGAAQPGHLVSPAMLACAFCRGFPTLGVLRKYNRDTCALQMDSRAVIEPNMHYGWCLGCYRVKQMMKRDCTRDPPLDEVAFRCAECVDAHAAVDLECILVESQECPNCHAHTEKAGGCNHITCICGQHWCFEFATGFDTAQLVYDHMYTSHRDDGGNE
ncbi:hypothetical protein H257_02104 [Aphanomyces astaci]|uniref:Uncharacterized protein n=1 Tax=Aphanomyces astaci TaxID=112090 RepID=W4H6B3_APHAT|nr:hypothetical protein H257_02104 [Aphanomyces astaci]ETV87106.1 hypothetical protein H257_02104 [Aphanomyces astaci]|eukprot:XP_009823905.1 hypothetical protein H257_02104 [Aphanomyces astaci]